MTYKSIANVANTLFDHIEKNPNNDIVILSLHCLTYLTSKSNDCKGNQLASNPDVFFGRLLGFYDSKVIGRDIGIEITEKIVEIILDLVMGCNNNEALMKVIDYMMKKYKEFAGNSNGEKRRIILSHLIGIIHTGLLSLKINPSANQQLLRSVL